MENLYLLHLLSYGIQQVYSQDAADAKFVVDY